VTIGEEIDAAVDVFLAADVTLTFDDTESLNGSMKAEDYEAVTTQSATSATQLAWGAITFSDVSVTLIEVGADGERYAVDNTIDLSLTPERMILSADKNAAGEAQWSASMIFTVEARDTNGRRIDQDADIVLTGVKAAVR